MWIESLFLVQALHSSTFPCVSPCWVSQVSSLTWLKTNPFIHYITWSISPQHCWITKLTQKAAGAYCCTRRESCPFRAARLTSASANNVVFQHSWANLMTAVHSHTSIPSFFASTGIPLTMVSQFRVLTHRKLFSIPFRRGSFRRQIIVELEELG